MRAVDLLQTVVFRGLLCSLRPSPGRVPVESPVIDLLGFSALRKHVLRSHLDDTDFDMTEPATASRRSTCAPFLPRRKTPITPSIDIGRYRVSSWTKQLPDSRFSASVSIRSGSGSSTHDRVLRLTPTFDDHDDAIRHAMDEGMAWLAERGVQRAPAPPAC